MKKKILAIGEIIWDVYPDRKVIGGAPLNFVAHASLCGAQSALVSAVGRDGLGDGAVGALEGFGVSCKYIKRTSQPTGQCLVTLDENAVPHYNVLRGVAYDNIVLDGGDIVSINAEKYDAFYFGTLIQREPVSRHAVRTVVENCSFGEIICDVNLRPDCYDEESVRFCLENATVLKVSIEEEPILRSFGMYIPDGNGVGDIARSLCRSFGNIRTVIITLGKDGSYAYDARDGREYRQGSVGDKVVSTVGAGDSFAAAWLTGYLEGMPIDGCMKRAAEISGFVVAHTEAVPMY
ncbi:MAG: carbohydrate kinase family protein [Eubacteriales bacterium]